MTNRISEGAVFIERFWSRVVQTAGCWEWSGAHSGGYGTTQRNQRTERAHRVAYELVVGPIPSGMELDHLCRNRGCVNPAHLEPVSHRENVLRGASPTVQRNLIGKCGNGHDASESYRRIGTNLVVRCNACRRAQRKAKRDSGRSDG